MKKTILIAAVLFFALSVSAFAQSSFTVASERPTVACCGLAEAVGAISFTSVPTNPADLTASGTIQITYTQPIANVGTTLGLKGVQIQTTGGAAATLTSVANIGSTGVVVLSIPVGQGAGYKVRVSNVRIDVSTSCNTPTAVTASAQSVGNDLTVSETDQIQVLSGIQPALLKPTVTAATVDASNGNVNAANPVSNTGTAVINVQEGFFNAFGLIPASDTSLDTGKVIRLTLTGTLPSGVSLVFPATDTSGLFTRSTAAGAPTASPLTVTSLATPVYYVLTANSQAGVQETFSIQVTVNTVGPYPLAPGSVSVSAHIGPVAATGYPRYTEGTCETDKTQFLTISGALTTTLLVPYAVDLGSDEGDYQTGIVVSNTTKDPGNISVPPVVPTSVMGFLPAIPQTGGLTVYFFPSDGSTVAPWKSTVSGANFGGLNSAGKLLPGGQFVAMVHQLFPTGVTSFAGYLFIITDFTNAHGEFFISTFDNFTHGALMLVVNQANVSTAVGRTIPEALNQ